jgi:hypothetical protein
VAPTAPPRYDAPVETAPATPIAPAEAAAQLALPQGDVELIGRVDDSLLDALVEMHNGTMENP